MIYRFGSFSLDPDRLELRDNEALVTVEPQVFSLLAFLIKHRGKVVTKDEIIDAVWDGRIVSDGTLNSRINAARRALEDDGKVQAMIKTFPRRGFRFIAELIDNGNTARTPASTLSSAAKPSIVVLPFENLSDDPEQEYFSDGITEDIITGLSAYHALQVIARNSSFAFKGQSATVEELGKALKVQYVVDGSVQKSNNRVRITARLADVANGSEIWSQRYDRELEDIFAIQDEVTESVVAILPKRLQAADMARAKKKNTSNMAAHDYLMRGIDHYYQATREDNVLALELLEKAIDLDPNYAQAYAWLACSLGQGKFRGYYNADITDRALDLLIRARDLDNNDSEVYRILAAIHTNMGKHEEAKVFIDRAIALNPNDPRILCQKCDLLIWNGLPDEGLKWLNAAKRRDPNMEEPWWRSSGRAKFELKEYDSAIELLTRIRHMRQLDRACMVASYAFLGRKMEAIAAAEEIVEVEPGFQVLIFIDAQPFVSQKNREHLMEGLLKAGMH